MFNLQGSEIIVILLLALVVLGPEKLPDAIRKFSQTYGELKKMGNGFQSELKSALDEPMREMRETADLVKRSADPARIAEEAENEARLRAEADAAALTGAADLPIDPAALAVSDPAAAADDNADDGDDGDDGDDDAGNDDEHGFDAQSSADNSLGAPLLVGKRANGEPVKKVNQIALSMARGPIDPQPAAVTVPGSQAAHAPTAVIDQPPAAVPPAAVPPAAARPSATPLTAMPQGAASMMAPPPPGTSISNPPPPPPPVSTDSDTDTSAP